MITIGLGPWLFTNYCCDFHTIYKPSPKSIPLFYYYLHGVMCAPRKLTCCSLVTLRTQTQLRHSALAKKKVQLGQIFCFRILALKHQAIPQDFSLNLNSINVSEKYPRESQVYKIWMRIQNSFFHVVKRKQQCT